MRKKIRGGISILVAAAMLLTGGGAGIAAGAEEAVQAEAAQEATAVEAEPVETGDAGTEAGIAPIAFPNDIDPDAQMDEIVEDGIRELSTVDKSQFIEESQVIKKETAFAVPVLDTMTRSGKSFVNTAYWSSDHQKGWTLGRGRYVWLMFDLSEELKDPELEGLDFVAANVRVTHRYSRTAGDTYKVRYIPDNSWNVQSDGDWTGKKITYNSVSSIFSSGTDVGAGVAKGNSTAMTTNLLPANGLTEQKLGADGIVSLCLYGEQEGTGADIASCDLTEANNYGQPLIEGYQPGLQFVYSNAGYEQLNYMENKPVVLSKIRDLIGKYDGMALSGALTLDGDENGVAVSYSVDDASQKWISVEGNECAVTRPTADEGDQDVMLTVTAQKAGVVLAYDLRMTVLALEAGIPEPREVSSVDKSQFIPEETVETVPTEYLHTRFETMTRTSAKGEYDDLSYWDSDHLKGWTVGRGRYLYLQFDLSETLADSRYKDRHIVSANTRITHRYGNYAGDTYFVRYIPDNTWNQFADGDWTGKKATFRSMSNVFAGGTDIGSGRATGVNNAMTTNQLPANGLKDQSLPEDGIITLCLYGKELEGTGADIASSDTTVANNKNQPLIDGYQPGLQLVFSNAPAEQVSYMEAKPFVLALINEIIRQYHGTEVSHSFQPMSGRDGMEVTYSVNDEQSGKWISVSGDTIQVVNPTAEEGDQNVVVTVTVSKNGAAYTCDMELTVKASTVNTVLPDGVREISSVDTTDFLDEDQITYVDAEYMDAVFDTMTREGSSYANTSYWSSNHETGWTVGRGRYVWLQFDAGAVLQDARYKNYNLAGARARITHRYGMTAGDQYNVRYLPDSSWNQKVNGDWSGKKLTHQSGMDLFQRGTDIGSGTAKGETDRMTTNIFDVSPLISLIGEDGMINLCFYGKNEGTGAEIASCDLTVANNGSQPLIDGYRPGLQLTFTNAPKEQANYLIDRPAALRKIRDIISQYKDTGISADFTPIGDSDMVSVTYSILDEESQKWLFLQDGKVCVRRPSAEEGDQSALLTVTAQRNEAKFIYDIPVTVMARQAASPLNEKNLSDLIAFCEQTIAEQKNAGNIAQQDGQGKGGALSPTQLAAWEKLIQEAKECDDVYEMPDHIDPLISQGVAFMGSGVIDNTIVYQSKNPYLDLGNTLVYSKERAKLQSLVWKAKAKLLIDREFFPKSAREALRVELERAELALQVDEDGTSMLKLPFTKNRMFYKSVNDYMIRYATSYKVMFHNYSGKSTGYGLEPVLNWYDKDGILYTSRQEGGDIDPAKLRAYVTKLVDNQKGLFENAKTYTGEKKTGEVGSFRKAEYDKVRSVMKELDEKLKGGDVYDIARTAVQFLDAAYDCRMTIALLSDVDVDENGVPRGNIVFSGDEVQDLKRRIRTNDALKQAYQEIKDGLKGISLEKTEEYWERWKANDKTLWEENPAFATPPASTGGKYGWGRHIKDSGGKELPANLPSGHTYTGKAYITIELGKEDNDTTGYSNLDGGGCGEAWIDNLTISSDDGNGKLELPNPDFEFKAVDGNRPLRWKLTTSGNGEGRWEDKRENVSSGNRSLYLHNPDGNSSVTWTSDPFDLPVLSSSDGFDIVWNIKQYGVFASKGVQIKFHFLTETANGPSEVVSAPNFYNAKQKPTAQGVGGYLVTLQRAALMAMLAENETDRIRYAKLAKVNINLYLDEMNQGIEHWLMTGARPDGIDAYGAVQTGRGSGAVGTAYSIIRYMTVEDGKPLYTDEEREELTRAIDFNIRNLNDIRDRYHMTHQETASGGDNWNSDMNMGAAMLGLAFGDTLEHAKAHMYNGIRVDESLLMDLINEDGSWPESVRYHNAAVSKLAVLAKSLRASTGIYDWFADEDIGFYKAFDYLTMIQTPRYASGNASTPFFGDHMLSSGDELYMCGLYYDEVAESHPEVALRMYGTWLNAGSPFAVLGNEDNHIQLLFGHSVDIRQYGDYKEELKKIGSTDYAKYFGTYIFRNNFMINGKESYLAMMIQDRATGHNHKDQLSFILYADNVPLVVDPGSAPKYWGGNVSNYTNSERHALVSFLKDASGNSFTQTGTTSTFRGFYSSDSLDIVRGSTKSSGQLYRDIAFIKNGFEAYVIWDQVTGASYGTMMNLPLYTRTENAITRNGNTFTAKMFGGIDLDITCLKGNYESAKVVTLNASGNYILREDENEPKIDHLQIRNNGNDGYLTVLFPRTKQRGRLAAEEIGEGIYQLTHSTGNSVYLVLNEGQGQKTVTLPEKNLIDLESLNQSEPTVYRDGTLTLAGRSMKILTSKVTTTQEAETASDGKPTETPVPSRQGGTTGSAAPGAAGGSSDNGGQPEPGLPGGEKPGEQPEDADLEAVVYRNLAVGQKAQIAYSVSGATSVSFRTSDKKIVSVTRDGMIRARKAGKAVLSVFVRKDGVTEKLSVNLTVKKKKKAPENVRKLGRIRTTKAGTPVIVMTKDLNVSGRSKFRIRKKDGAKVWYRSSDTGVAAVSENGVITGKAKGTADITAGAAYGGVTCKYQLRVTVRG